MVAVLDKYGTLKVTLALFTTAALGRTVSLAKVMGDVTVTAGDVINTNDPLATGAGILDASPVIFADNEPVVMMVIGGLVGPIVLSGAGVGSAVVEGVGSAVVVVEGV